MQLGLCRGARRWRTPEQRRCLRETAPVTSTDAAKQICLNTSFGLRNKFCDMNDVRTSVTRLRSFQDSSRSAFLKQNLFRRSARYNARDNHAKIPVRTPLANESTFYSLQNRAQEPHEGFRMNGTTSAAAADAHVGGSSGEAVSDTGLTAMRFAPVIAANEAMPFTQYHSKYFAYELTRRVGADQADKLAQSLSNATVDLNPHQVDAALFAFRSPLSRGAILADEVGLGKTIEAGIVISQLWAEKKRRILIIVPASLRKQWSSELADKFFIPSVILESKSFREMSRKMPSPVHQPLTCVRHLWKSFRNGRRL